MSFIIKINDSKPVVYVKNYEDENSELVLYQKKSVIFVLNFLKKISGGYINYIKDEKALNDETKKMEKIYINPKKLVEWRTNHKDDLTKNQLDYLTVGLENFIKGREIKKKVIATLSHVDMNLFNQKNENGIEHIKNCLNEHGYENIFKHINLKNLTREGFEFLLKCIFPSTDKTKTPSEKEIREDQKHFSLFPQNQIEDILPLIESKNLHLISNDQLKNLDFGTLNKERFLGIFPDLENNGIRAFRVSQLSNKQIQSLIKNQNLKSEDIQHVLLSLSTEQMQSIKFDTFSKESLIKFWPNNNQSDKIKSIQRRFKLIPLKTFQKLEREGKLSDYHTKYYSQEQVKTLSSKKIQQIILNPQLNSKDIEPLAAYITKKQLQRINFSKEMVAKLWPDTDDVSKINIIKNNFRQIHSILEKLKKEEKLSVYHKKYWDDFL